MAIESIAAPPIRRLTTVLLADVVGYSRMMSGDEDATHARLAVHVRELIDPAVAGYRGRFVRSMGDGMLVEFACALDAVRCALDIQRGLAERQAGDPEPIQLRIGINTGDVLADERDIYGNSVNVTARLEALATPGTVCVGQSIYDQMRGQPDLFFADRGSYRVKNIPYPIRVFQVANQPIRLSPLRRLRGPRTRWSLAGTLAAVILLPAAGVLHFEQNRAVARTNTIIVLPFRNVDGNAADDYLADAITDDVTTELSRLRRAWVIATATAFTYKSKPIDVRQVGRETGVRYALEGSVKRAGPVVRVNAQLIDTESGANLWADRFEYSTTSLLDLQDAVIVRIASSLHDEVIRQAAPHEVGTFAADGNPLDERLRAMSAFVDISTPERSLEARRYAEAGLRANPEDARLWAVLACTLASDYLNGRWNGTDKPAVDLAQRAAERAKGLNPNEALAYFALGFVYRIKGEHERARQFFEDAINRDKNSAGAYAQLANELVFLGHADEAVEKVQEAIRRSPGAPSTGVYRWVEGRAFFVQGDWKNAIRSLDAAVRLRPNLWFIHAWLTAAYALNNQAREAEVARDLFQSVFPDQKYSFARINEIYDAEQYSTPALKQAASKLLEGLRKAGLK
jgi:class 3 adenylate cyclase/TolB-like protein/tetratricopeptide (TPR) repeat protein